MEYSKEIEELISRKQKTIFKRTRKEAIQYIKEFFPSVKKQMDKEEIQYIICL